MDAKVEEAAPEARVSSRGLIASVISDAQRLVAHVIQRLSAIPTAAIAACESSTA